MDNRPWRRMLLLIGLCLLGWQHLAHAQNTSRWRVFRGADGLGEAFCTTVTMSPRTNLWVSHFQNGFLTAYDGYVMRKVPAPGIGPFRIHETSDGQIWTVAPEGIQEYRDEKWIRYLIPEIRALGPTNSLLQTRQISLFPYKRGHVLICFPENLAEFSNENAPKTTFLKTSSETKLERFSEMVPARDGGVWIAGAKGLGRIKGSIQAGSTNVIIQEFIPPAVLGIRNFQRPFEDDNGGVTLVAESPDQKRVIAYFDGQQWTVKRLREKIRMAWRDAEKTFWAMTSTTLLRCDEGSQEFVEEPDVAVGSQLFDAALDKSGTLWIGTSDGLVCRNLQSWRTPLPLKVINGRVHAMAEDGAGNLWIASNGGLHSYRAGELQSFAYPEALETVFQPIDSLYFLPENKLVMNADGRLLEFDLNTHVFQFRSHPTMARAKLLGWIKPGVLCTEVSDKNQKRYLQTFDGSRFSSFLSLPDDWNLTTPITSFLSTQNGVIWVGTSTGLKVYQDGVWKTFAPTDAISPDGALSLIETADGKIWCGGNERIWEFNGKSWIGVRSAFNRINKIIKATDSSYWVASNDGLRGMRKGAWLLNSVLEGIANSAVFTIFEDRQRNLWVGTAHGLSLYDASIDPDPPRATVVKIDNEKSNLPRDTVALGFSAQDRWKITEGDRLLYSYRLDEQDWTPWGPINAISFSELSSGKHVFQLRAIDRNWNISLNPAVLEFFVTLPWYQETRLVMIALTGCVVALFFAVLAYNRHRKLVHSYEEIEKIVALRTQQLEKANQELLHSQKMTALGTLSAGIAHDFNNILSIIKGSAQIIETNLEDREKIHTRLNRIKTVVEQGSGIVRAMLGFSRSSEKALAACDVNNLVEETMKLLGDRFLREVEIKFESSPGLPQIPASREFIQQIVLNFIFNAADALNGPGRIIIRTGRFTELTDYIALRPATAPEYLFIAVEDFGCGIGPETMPRIFEPFFTTKAFSARRGTGLGLSMVYELAKEIGCGLAVKSTVGKGSVFMLVLPLLQDPPEPGR
jgi:signal transduction histidine kinase